MWKTALFVALGVGAGVGTACASERMLDEMDDPADWALSVNQGGQARLLSVAGADGGRALCMEFDFGSLPGRASLTRQAGPALADNAQFQLQWRGLAPQASLQLQVLDDAGTPRWAGSAHGSSLGSGWQQLRLPLDSAPPPAVAALRWIVSSASGGSGLVCLDRLQLRAGSDSNEPFKATALADTATALQQRMVDGRRDTLWVSSGVKQQTVSLDLGRVHELGGLQVDWGPGLRATDYRVQRSVDGRRWQPMREVRAATGNTDRLRFGAIDARYLRLDLLDGPNWRYGIIDLLPQPVAWGSSLQAFMRELGRQLPAGSLPPSLGNGAQAWTVVGAEQATAPAWLGSDGSVETWPGQFSVAPWVQVDGRWLGAADVDTMPVAAAAGHGHARWQHGQLQLEVLAQGVHQQRSGPWLRTLYRLRNPDVAAHRYSLALALRPFQLNPGQRLGDLPGGVGRIEQLVVDGARARINGQLALLASSAPTAGFATHFEAGLDVTHLRAADLPAQTRADDSQGLASGAMLWRWQLAPGQSRELEVWLPMSSPQLRDTPPQVAVGAAGDGMQLLLPGAQGQAMTLAWQAALARLQAERAGPWLRVDSRRQLRASQAQEAQMARALLQGGVLPPVAEWLLAKASALDEGDCMGWSYWLELAANLHAVQPWTPGAIASVHGYRQLAAPLFADGGSCAASLAQTRVAQARTALQVLLPVQAAVADPAHADSAVEALDAIGGQSVVVDGGQGAGVAAPLPMAAAGERAALLQQAMARIGNASLPAGWQQWQASTQAGLVDASQAASQVLAIAALLVDVQPDHLRLAPGLPADWLLAGGLQVDGLGTPWGRLGYSSLREGNEWVLRLQPGLSVPPAGLVVDWPWPGEPGSAHADGHPLHWQDGRLQLMQLPAELRIALPPQ